MVVVVAVKDLKVGAELVVFEESVLVVIVVELAQDSATVAQIATAELAAEKAKKVRTTRTRDEAREVGG